MLSSKSENERVRPHVRALVEARTLASARIVDRSARSGRPPTNQRRDSLMSKVRYTIEKAGWCRGIDFQIKGEDVMCKMR